MTTGELRRQIAFLRQIQGDHTHVEAKAAANEIPKRIWETLSAFANTPSGGMLLLGVAEQQNFQVTGVGNPAKLQHDLASVCTEMQPPIRARIEVHHLDRKHVIAAEIPEVPLQEKPCFYPPAGYTNGAFIRVADGDRKLSSYEVQMMLSGRGQPTDDEEPVPESKLSDLDSRLVKGLVSRLRRNPGSTFHRLDDHAVLKTTKVLVRYRKSWVCSLGGLLALGKYPQQFFPGLALTFLVYPGSAIGESGSREERFLDNARIEGPIPQIVPLALQMLARNSKHRAVVRGAFREDVGEYPSIAIREALVNALAHRDLSKWSRATPVQVQMFSNRLVIYNPGGLYGPVSVDLLGQVGISATRNLAMVRLLEDVTPDGEDQIVCENRGSGIGAMIRSLERAGLPVPEFKNRISAFEVTFSNQRQPVRHDRRGDIVTLLRTRGPLSRAEISRALELTEIATRKWLQTMRREKLIVATEKKAKSKNVRYRLPGRAK